MRTNSTDCSTDAYYDSNWVSAVDGKEGYFYCAFNNATHNCSSGDYHHCTHHSINSHSLQNEDSSYVSTLILIDRGDYITFQVSHGDALTKASRR